MVVEQKEFENPEERSTHGILAELSPLRKSIAPLWQPDHSEQTEILRQSLPFIEKTILTPLNKKRESMRQLALFSRIELSSSWGKEVSNELPSVIITTEILRKFSEKMIMAASRPDFPRFAFLYDFTSGGFSVDEAIHSAIFRRDTGRGDEAIREAIGIVEAIGENENRPVPIGESVEYYMRFQGRDNRRLALLQADPSGFSLVDDCLAGLIGEKSADTFQAGFVEKEIINQFVIAGAKTMVRLYKEVRSLFPR